MKVYKVRNKQTGLFSTGPRYTQWRGTGKIYTTKWGAENLLRRHCSTIKWIEQNHPGYEWGLGGVNIDDLEVVAYELEESNAND